MHTFYKRSFFLAFTLPARYNDLRMNGGFKTKVKLTVHRDKPFFGPGIVTLLELIDETGSVKLACRQMDLSYTKAWTILNRADEQLGYPLIKRSQGGRQGGGASLTDRGRETIRKYREWERIVSDYAEKTFNEFYPEGM